VNEILTNYEIDALLQMFRAEGAATEAAAPAKVAQPELFDRRAVSPVDLLKPNRLGREQMRVIERYFEGAGRLLSATISDRLRLDMRCDCVAVEQQRFGNWLEQLPGPVAIHVMRVEPFRLPAVLTASSSLLYGAVDRILGGSGRVARVPADFTAAEHTVAEALVGPCMDRICESLAEIGKLSWSMQSRSCNRSTARVLPSQEVVLSVCFQVVGEFLLGDLRLVIPFADIEPLLDRFGRDARERLAPGSMRATVAGALRGMPLHIGVELGGARIRLRQLLELKPGDVIPLCARIGQPALVPVQGLPKFTGSVGRIGNRLGVQLVDVMAGPGA
jgi:flagellar motor switch protein FliM